MTVYCRFRAARPGRRARRARSVTDVVDRALHVAPLATPSDAVLPVPARRREGASRRSRSPLLAWRLVRARATADAGERLLAARRARPAAPARRGCASRSRRGSGSPRSPRPRSGTSCRPTPERLSRGPLAAARAVAAHLRAAGLRRARRCSSRSRWGVVRDWLADVERLRRRDVRPRAAGCLRRRAALARARAAPTADARAAPPLRARLRVAPASAPAPDPRRDPVRAAGAVVVRVQREGRWTTQLATSQIYDRVAARYAAARARAIALLGPADRRRPASSGRSSSRTASRCCTRTARASGGSSSSRRCSSSRAGLLFALVVARPLLADLGGGAMEPPAEIVHWMFATRHPLARPDPARRGDRRARRSGGAAAGGSTSGRRSRSRSASSCGR